MILQLLREIIYFIFFLSQIIILFYFLFVDTIYTFFIFLSIQRTWIHSKIITNNRIVNIAINDFYKPISIILPAFNEENIIINSIDALLNLEYPEYEIIVVNDGSNDNTLDALIHAFNLIKIEKPIRLKLPHKSIKDTYLSLDHNNLFVIDKENGGKYDALNAGINASCYPIYCSIDADSLLEKDALARASRLFLEDKEVIAVGGIVRVLNGSIIKDNKVIKVKAPKKMLECFQAIEYARAFLTGRIGLSFLKIPLIISGAFGIFRKDLVFNINGYRNSIGEDMDLVVRLHKFCIENDIKYKILFVEDPICWTQVPFDLKSLLKQRNRWQRGLIDTLWYNKNMFLNPKFGRVGILGYNYFLFVEMLGAIIEFAGYIGFIYFYLIGLLSPEFVFFFFVIAILWLIFINIGALLIDNFLYKRYDTINDIIILLFYGFVEVIGYRQLLTMERFIATFEFWKNTWDKPKREKIKNFDHNTAG